VSSSSEPKKKKGDEKEAKNDFGEKHGTTPDRHVKRCLIQGKIPQEGGSTRVCWSSKTPENKTANCPRATDEQVKEGGGGAGWT